MQELVTKAIKTAAKDSSLVNEVYQDSLQPTVKNVGQALGTLSSTLNVLLAPISWAVYGFEQIDNIVKEKLKDKLSNTPIEELKEPEANIVIPAYEALRYSLNKEQLKEMYINLIANSMQNNKSDKVHPAFVEVIKQLSAFDAELLEKLFANSISSIPKLKMKLQKSKFDTVGYDIFNIIISSKYYDVSLIDQYTLSLENLERLKIVHIDHNAMLLAENIYDDLFGLLNTDSLRNAHPEFQYVNMIKGSISLTNFGRAFVKNIF